MKKFFTLFAISAALILVVSCGGSSKNDDKTDTGETVNDEDVADTDAADTEPAGDNEPGGETTSDDTDSDDSDTTPVPKPDDDADTEQGDPCAEFEGAIFDEETNGCECPERYKFGEGEESKKCVPDPCAGLVGAIHDDVGGGCYCPEGYKFGEGDESNTCVEDPVAMEYLLCESMGGTMGMNTTGEKFCWREEPCDSLPENAEWFDPTYLSVYDKDTGKWSKASGPYHLANYSYDVRGCYFKCSENYFWNGASCSIPCDPNPCEGLANSTGVCSVRGDSCVCGCNEGYVWDVESMTCQHYCGAVFNGTSSFAILPYNAEKTPLLYPAQWTIEVWFMQTDIHDSNGTPLVAMQNDDNAILYTLTGISDVGGDVTFLAGGLKLENGAASVSTRGADKYLYGWHHIAFVNNGSVLTLFVDGVLKKTKEYEGPAATLSNSDLWIGKLSTVIGSEQVEVTDYFEGMIDQIRFSKTARYSTDFEPVTMTVDANTVALWDFNGNTNDSSTNALNLTGTNITYTTECR